MPTYIYMSVGKKTKKGIIDPKTGTPTMMLNYRGEVADDEHVSVNDPATFTKRMAMRGHAVVPRRKPIMPGTVVTVPGFGDLMVSYPPAFADDMERLIKLAGE